MSLNELYQLCFTCLIISTFVLAVLWAVSAMMNRQDSAARNGEYMPIEQIRTLIHEQVDKIEHERNIANFDNPDGNIPAQRAD